MIKFIRKTEAGVTVEFALLVPALLLILAFAVETSRLHMASMILERSLYDIAYQVRVSRGKNLSTVSREVLAKNSHGLFDSSEVTVEATSARNIAGMDMGDTSRNSGSPGDLVRLELTAELSILGNVLTKDVKAATFTMTTYFVNEPDY